MGFFDFLKKKPHEKAGDNPAPEAAAEQSPWSKGAGGEHPLAPELSRLRWTATAESVTVAASKPNPTLWANGRMSFPVERATAHDFEAVRDQLSNYVAARLAGEATAVYDAARHVGLARERLRVADRDLVEVEADWQRQYRLAKHDISESRRFRRRYHQLSYRENGISMTSRVLRFLTLKRLIVFVLIAIEFVMTAVIFGEAFKNVPLLIPPGWLFSLGTIVLLMVTPHFAAQGLKDGRVAHHSFERADFQKRNLRVPVELVQMDEREREDDLTFRRASWLMLTVLAASMVPLAFFRAQHVRSGDQSLVWWFCLFFLIQVGISAYFFFREAHDYGPFSEDLAELYLRRGDVREARMRAIAGVGEAATYFQMRSEDLLFTLQEAPRWDNQIVELQLGTLHYGRHIISHDNTDIAPFVVGATIPSLGSRDDAAASPLPLEPLSDENALLDADRPFGRRWRIRRIGEEWVADFEEVDGEEDEVGDDVAWMITKTPNTILEEVLDRYFDLGLEYERPEILDTLQNENGPLFEEIPLDSEGAEPLVVPDTKTAAPGASADDEQVQAEPLTHIGSAEPGLEEEPSVEESTRNIGA